MPRRNNRKTTPQSHGASIYDNGFKRECYGCAFAGSSFKCLAADGCLLSKPDGKECDNAPNTNGENRTGTER
jgi:hypothetical protein